MAQQDTLSYESIMTMFEHAPVGILLMKETKIIDINKAALDLMEYQDKQELIGQNPSIFSPEYQPTGLTSQEQAVINFGLAVEHGVHQFDWVHETKTGETKWFNVILKRLVDGTALFVAYWIEITQERRFRKLFDNFMEHIPASIYIKDESLKYVYLNGEARRLNNMETKEPINTLGLSAANILDDETARIVEESDKSVLKHGGSDESILSFEAEENTKRWFRNIKFIFEDVDYKKYIGGIMSDITDLNSANMRNKKILESLITTIQKITESRDPYTSGHETRVSSLSVAIGRRLGFDEHRLEGLRIGSLIHDIGKIQVPLEILNRPGRLTGNQLQVVRDHAVVGFDLVEALEFEWPIQEMVRHHHEKYDGSGYPDGLKGTEIILEARIICVADVLEAMSSHRPYRPALPLLEAVRELTQGKGILYDPLVVDICLEIIQEGTVTLDGWLDR